MINFWFLWYSTVGLLGYHGFARVRIPKERNCDNMNIKFANLYIYIYIYITDPLNFHNFSRWYNILIKLSFYLNKIFLFNLNLTKSETPSF